jgi:hypothetical protein
MKTQRCFPLRSAVLFPMLLISLTSGLAGTTIQLQPAVTLQAGAAPLYLGVQAIPCVADWNGDGLLDLILGYRPADKVAVFLNVGASDQPAFGSSTNLQAAGADIRYLSEACGAPAPWVCDYDHDGQRDLLVGTGKEGYVYFHRNVGSDAQPLLASGVQLTVGAAALTVTARATPYVHDWDEDGLEDLLCGVGDGQVCFFRNIGTAQSPAYAPAVLLRAGGAALDLGDRSVVRVFDWDGDGLKDLVGSASYNVSWCRNTNRNSSPVLEPPVAVMAPVAGSGLVAINTGYRMRLELVDWNNDGVLDLLIGRDNGLVNFYEGYRFAVASITRSPSEELVLRWNSAPFVEYDVLSGESPNALDTQLATSLASAGRTTSWTNRAGAGSQFFLLRMAR